MDPTGPADASGASLLPAETLVFRGETVHAIDPKGRVVVPKRLAEALLGGTTACVLSAGQDPCINLFSKAAFEAAVARMNLSPFLSREQRAAQRLLFSRSFDVEIDGSGRVLVPEKLRRLLGDEKEVVILGNHDHAEIWGRATWEKYEAQNEALAERMHELLADPRDSGSRGG